MAPALSRRDRKPGSMEDHAMGLQNADSFLKDSQEMEQILGALDGGDILQVIKTMERAAGESDAMFPLAAFERDFLADGEAAEGEAGAERLARLASVQAGLERRCDFLHRRLRIQQARHAGKHVSEEVAQLFERAQLAAPPGSPASAPPAPLSRRGVRALLQRLASGAALEQGAAPPGLAPAAAAQRCQLSIVEHHLDSDATLSSSGAESADEAVMYNNRQQQPLPLSKRALWKWSRRRAWIASRWTWLQAQVQELEYRLRQHAELQRQVAASKGGPLLQQPQGYSETLPGDSCARTAPLRREGFRKRRLLQMHNLHTTAAPKAAKPSDIRCICQWPLGGCAVCTGRALPAHPLPPACTLTQRQRLALVDPTFHRVLSTPADVSSSIHYSGMMCDPVWQQKSCRGAVKSLKGCQAKLPPAPPPPPSPPHPHPHSLYSHKKRKYNRLKRGRPSQAMMDQSRRRPSLMELEGGAGSSPPPSPSPDPNRYRKERNRLSSSYDIDNIVIPHSIAANTKPEILHYKEILTPKWRMIDPEEIKSNNNGLVRKSLPGEEHDSDVEDISDASVLLRHERCEALERGKHLKKRKGARRAGGGAGAGQVGRGSTAPPTPSQTPPHNNMIVDESSRTSDGGVVSVVAALPLTAPPSPAPPTTATLTTTRPHTPDVAIGATPKRRATDDIVEVVMPYSPRIFPLSEETYSALLGDMPANHPLSLWRGEGGDSYSDSHSPPLLLPPSTTAQPSEEDEDPNDPEWRASNTTDR